jgi:GNAT superfamily N-acetyltransferase
LLSLAALLHPIEYISYFIESMLKPKSSKITFTRICQEFFLKKFPKGTLPSGQYSELRSIAVDPEHRGSGLAFRLLDASLKQLQRNGGRRCIAWVTADNQPSLRLFEKAGFSNLTTRKDAKSEVHILRWEEFDDRC